MFEPRRNAHAPLESDTVWTRGELLQEIEAGLRDREEWPLCGLTRRCAGRGAGTMQPGLASAAWQGTRFLRRCHAFRSPPNRENQIPAYTDTLGVQMALWW